MVTSTADLPVSAGSWRKPSLRRVLESTNRFLFCAELVTSRGMITEQSGRKVLELARSLAEHPAISALSITDNPGGKAMLSPDTLGTDLISRGQDVIIHLSCKDWNRNALQSRGWKLASEGFHNVLALSGDCPTGGYNGNAAGVFDIDSVGLLKMFSEMNSGTPFFLGAVVNNYKRYEREVMPQYFKLARKIREGAAFVINQVGYDVRKMDELLKYMRLYGMNVPVLANVYVLSTPAARYFHAGNIPGCVVSDDLLALCEKQAGSPDRGKAFYLEFAAKQCAIAKGLGFRGAYLGGHLKFSDYERILGMAQSFGEDDWKLFTREIAFHYPDEFYYFEPEGENGLSSTEISREYLRSKTPAALADLRKHLPLSYKLDRLVHEKIFEPASAGFRAGACIAAAAERSEGVRKALHAGEQVFKILSFDCRDCGDCSLPDIAYLCPESQCAKNQRNGPCGGTREGKCEVGEKDCIWARAYDRLKAYGEEVHMLDGAPVFRESALKGTSAWANMFLKRDHHAKEGSLE